MCNNNNTQFIPFIYKVDEVGKLSNLCSDFLQTHYHLQRRYNLCKVLINSEMPY